jgi:hypothetical protein
MTELEAARRLVKSTPELWAACSDPEALGRHLQAFGEIKITRLEPETTVAWEGESASGTVFLEPSGWGTKVTLRAGVEGLGEQEVAASPPARDDIADPPDSVALEVRRRAGGLSGLLRRVFGGAPPEPGDSPVAPAAAHAETDWPEPPEAVPDTAAALEAALDSLGRAHHRPYSRG